MRALLCLLLAVLAATPLRAADFAPVKPGVQLQFPRDFGAHPATCNTPATIATMASEIGKKTFQPSRIN